MPLEEGLDRKKSEICARELTGRTKADLLAVEFTMSAGDVENLVSLPPGWFASRPADVVQLKLAR
jgi:hypothetical protein